MVFHRTGKRRLFTRFQKHERREHKTNPRTIKRVVQAFAPYKVQIILVLVAIILATMLGLINPFLIGLIFDVAIEQRNAKLLIIFVTIMFITPFVIGLIGVGQTYLNNLIGQNVMRDFRNKLFKHLQRMSLSFFTLTRTGEIQSRLSNDVNGVQSVVTNTATTFVSNISTVLSTIIAMLVISPLLTLISLSMLPFFVLITYNIGRARHATSKKTQESMASLTTMMQETLSVSGILLAKTFHRQKYAEDRFETENQRMTNLMILQQLLGRWFFMAISVFFSATPSIVYLVAGLQIIGNPAHPALTLGRIVAFMTLQSRLLLPFGQLLTVQVEIQGALALFERIFEYLDLPVDIADKPDAIPLSPDEVHGKVAFRDVSFTYQPDLLVKTDHLLAAAKSSQENILREPVTSEATLPRSTLSHVSFEIKPGQLAALVGHSGAGKTTTTYLVPRLYDVESGVVEIDGHNVKDLTLESLETIIGVVTQETYLLHASVRENLLYARTDATEEEMISAAKAAAIHERIMELDHGYDTIVGERGYKLSGGEKQRIAIARVILKDPRILILDEATSALDTHSERLIQAAFESLMKNRTTLAIAHRLSTILAADIILVFDKGQIVERGTHEELLARGGFYARLYNEQFMKRAISDSSLLENLNI